MLRDYAVVSITDPQIWKTIIAETKGYGNRQIWYRVEDGVIKIVAYDWFDCKVHIVCGDYSFPDCMELFENIKKLIAEKEKLT